MEEVVEPSLPRCRAASRPSAPVQVTVTLSAAYDQPVTMSFQTVNGTATTSDGDYIAIFLFMKWVVLLPKGSPVFFVK